MSFDITCEADYLKRKTEQEQARSDNAKESVKRFRENIDTLETLKANGQYEEYRKLLKFCFYL